MHFCQKLGGNDNRIKDCRNGSRERNCLTLQQTDFIYKKVELGSLINKETIREELDPGIKLDKIDDNGGDENPYRELTVNNVCKIENTLSQMEQWSILSNVINYMQYNKNPPNFHPMIIKPVNTNGINKEIKGKNQNESLLRVKLADVSDRSTEECLDRHED